MSVREGAPLVVGLAELDRDSLELAGGKAANLGELIRAGAPVPDGFVITTAAYAAAVAGLGADALDDRDLLRERLTAVALPDELATQIVEAYHRIGAGPVAVRSSATAEDLPGAAFAGQQDTYLGVVGAEAVLDAVRNCWASLWNERAAAYRDRLGLAPELVQIAVVVQRLVDAEVAGVMFTTHPVTGVRDEYVIDASPGLGEAVVSGQVTPDHYVTSPNGRIRSWTAGRHEVVISRDEAGLRTEVGEPTGLPVVDEAVIGELCRRGNSVAEHFGRPQDIEWAWADGAVWLLQARPMTALPPPPLHLSPVQRRMSGVLLDYVTARPYPIDMTTWVPYGPTGMMGAIAADIGLTGIFTEIFHETDGVVDRADIPLPKPRLRLITAPWRSWLRARRFDPAHWTSDPRHAALMASAAALTAAEVSAMSWSELVARPRRVLDAVGPLTGLRRDHLPGVGASMIRLAVLTRVLGRSRLAAELLHGAPTRTTAANSALADLADLARRDPTVRSAVADGDLNAALADDDFGTAFGVWIAEYGYRETVSPILITPPTLGELPETVLSMIKVLMDDPPTSVRRADPLAELLRHPLLRSPRRRAVAERSVAAARAGMAFREDSHVAFTVFLRPLRRALLEIGHRLAEAGVLETAEDVYHCRLAELEALPDPAGPASAPQNPALEEMSRTVSARAALRAELAGVPLINIAQPPTADGDDAVLTGTGASSGVATGPVRLIRGPEEFGRLRAGDVMVCPYTNPSWTPLFQRAAAVVVDSGSAASHAAIVAREYGIPAVMGTRAGTSVLADGDLIQVDGTQGRITRAEASRVLGESGAPSESGAPGELGEPSR